MSRAKREGMGTIFKVFGSRELRSFQIRRTQDGYYPISATGLTKKSRLKPLNFVMDSKYESRKALRTTLEKRQNQNNMEKNK